MHALLEKRIELEEELPNHGHRYLLQPGWRLVLYDSR